MVERQARTVSILGSTGSIGRSTVDVLLHHRDLYRVRALTGYRNGRLLAEQAKLLKPDFVAVADDETYSVVKDLLAGTNIAIGVGPSAMIEAASMPADWIMAAIVGAAGLGPTLAAIRQGAVVALANKETLVVAGSLVMAEVARAGTILLPVDSEHSAIFQVLDRSQLDQVEKIILTASGGPFRGWSREAMRDVTPEQAQAHPNWSMGSKISVDSATMMNKGLELIEAYHLFGISESAIDILVHPQSIIHSLVAWRDGSVLAQMGTPDMRTPIAYALGWPRRIEAPSPRLDFASMGDLTFESPDPERFPALRLARQALAAGGCFPAVLNAANEIAVAAFLARRIGFLSIAALVEETLSAFSSCHLATLEDAWAIDAQARDLAQTAMARFIL